MAEVHPLDTPVPAAHCITQKKWGVTSEVWSFYLHFPLFALHSFVIAGAKGVEPLHADSESVVLPLDDAPSLEQFLF